MPGETIILLFYDYLIISHVTCSVMWSHVICSLECGHMSSVVWNVLMVIYIDEICLLMSACSFHQTR